MTMYKNEKDNKNLQGNLSSLYLVVGQGDIVKMITWATPLNRFKGNKLVWESGKVNQAIKYRNELSPEKQAIT